MRTANNEWSIVVFNLSSRRIVTSAILTIALLMAASADMAMGSTRRSRLQPACGACAKPAKANVRNGAKTAKATPCHPKGYVDPKIAKNFNAAMRDMKRAGIKPQVTSIWRSSEDQARLHNCTASSRCRRANPGLYRALPPGRSLHEAGLAVDMSGIAAGPRGAKRLTPRGRRIVGIMRKNGFSWRYGLADPAHFEANPRKAGYRSVKQAIARSQSTCAAKIAYNTRADIRPGRGPQPPPAARRTASVKQTPAQVASTKPTRHSARALAGR
jgi:D-alanyl-D-alanine carboxypeptidase